MKLTLKEKKKGAGDAISFIFDPETPMTWAAGQYLHYTLPHEHADNRKEERWFTISSAPHEGRPTITTRIIDPVRSSPPEGSFGARSPAREQLYVLPKSLTGRSAGATSNGVEKASSFKKALSALPIGATIEVDEPEGDFIVEDSSKELVMIAGGIGITPYHAILTDLDHKKVPFKATLLYANRDSNFYFKEELGAIAARNPDLKICYIISPDQIDEAKIHEAATDPKKSIFYISGPELMVEQFEKMMLRAGIPDEHLKRDFFSGYDWPLI